MPQTPSKMPRLGEVEMAILEFLWKIDDADVGETHQELRKKRQLSPNTVGSALERLNKKGLVTRTKVSHAYRYTTTISREAFRAKKLVEAAGGVKSLTEKGLLAAFVDLVGDSDRQALAELENLIRVKKREAGG